MPEGTNQRAKLQKKMHIRKSAVHFSFDKGLIDRAKALEDCPEGLKIEDRHGVA